MWTSKLDPEQKPKRIDIVVSNATKDGNELTLLGIYELDGDNLRICASAGSMVKRTSTDAVALPELSAALDGKKPIPAFGTNARRGRAADANQAGRRLGSTPAGA